MKPRNYVITGIISALAMFLIIIDSKTALTGAKEGITLCLYTVIPSIFPFLILSSMLGSVTSGLKSPILRPLGRLCKIPEGTESLLILGLIGGYPVGAQSITRAYFNGQITKTDAQRMLGFCNNAGPAFIFGMLSSLFDSPIHAWIIWFIHIAGALLVGCMLPGAATGAATINRTRPLTFVNAVERSIRTMAVICGWVIIFRIFLAILQHWLLWYVSPEEKALIFGLMELSNGCSELFKISAQGTRFVFASIFLSLGGLCVMMQTLSVTSDLGAGMYFLGKILQSLITFLLSAIAQSILLPASERMYISFPIMIFAAGIIIGINVWLRRKKVLAFPAMV